MWFCLVKAPAAGRKTLPRPAAMAGSCLSADGLCGAFGTPGGHAGFAAAVGVVAGVVRGRFEEWFCSGHSVHGTRFGVPAARPSGGSVDRSVVLLR